MLLITLIIQVYYQGIWASLNVSLFFFVVVVVVGHDETLKGMVFRGRGEACQKIICENREYATIHPFATFTGDVLMCYVIFAS